MYPQVILTWRIILKERGNKEKNTKGKNRKRVKIEERSEEHIRISIK